MRYVDMLDGLPPVHYFWFRRFDGILNIIFILGDSVLVPVGVVSMTDSSYWIKILMKVVVDIQLNPQFWISAFFSSFQNSPWRTPNGISIFIIHHLATTTLLLPSSSSTFFFFFWFHRFLLLLVTCGFNRWIIVNLWYWVNHYFFHPSLFHHYYFSTEF